MHGTVPALRSVTSAVSHSPSKIPHLRFHIVQRRALCTRATRHRDQQISRQQRCQSTFTPFIGAGRDIEYAAPSNAAMEDLESESTASKTHVKAFPSKRAMELLLKHSNLLEIMQDGVPDRILSGLMSDSIGTPFIRNAPDHLFNKALLAIDPEYFIGPHKRLFRHMRRTADKSPLDTFKGIDERLSAFAAYLDRIVVVRREYGKRLDLEACRHLLKWAGTLGDERLATYIMTVVMPEDGAQPDLESHNYYCEALVWSNAFTAEAKYSLRVTPKNLELRSATNPGPKFGGHKTANFRKINLGVRAQVLQVFKETTRAQQSPDETTFIHLMIAMGREADLEGAKSILKSVWNIDVNLLGVYDEEEVESPTFYEEGHHLHPTEALLFAVVHVFGSNNDVRTAWLLMDFISRNYAIPVSEHVWDHLLEWAFVLSLRRSNSQKTQGLATGQISPEAFLQMYKLMADEPHNIKPGAMTHYLLSRSWRDRRHLDNAVFHIEQLQEIVNQQHTTIKRSEEKLMRYVEDAAIADHPNAFSTSEFHQLRRQYSMDFLELQRDLQLLRFAVEMNLLREDDWAGSGKLKEWERRVLPQFVEKFDLYLPTNVKYHTRTGTVNIFAGTQRNKAVFRRFQLYYRAATFIYNALDTEDQATLDLRMRSLPEVIRSRTTYCYRCESTDHSSDACPRSAPLDTDSESSDGDVVRGGFWALSEDALQTSPVAQDVVLSSPVWQGPGTERKWPAPSLPFV